MNVERWGWSSVAVNVMLSALNLAIAVASGSLAVAAEMVHNAVDVVSALGVLLGLKLSARKKVFSVRFVQGREYGSGCCSLAHAIHCL